MPYLIQNPEANSPKIHNLKSGENKIGRYEENHIVIDAAELSTSRYHAKITIDERGVIIEDVPNNKTDTLVNQKRIDSCRLKHGDFIKCGNVVFKFVDALDLDEDPALSIIKRLPPAQSGDSIQEIVQQENPENQDSVILLPQEDANQRRVDKLKILLDLSKQLSFPADDLNKVLDKILELVFQIMGVDRAVILMVDEETNGELKIKAAKSRSGALIDKEPHSKTIVNYVYRTGEALLIDNASMNGAVPINAESIFLKSIHASMCVPMKPREEVIGVFYVDNLALANVYSEEDLHFLTVIVNTAAIAVENAQIYKKMQAEEVMRAKLERFFPQSVRKKLHEEGTLDIIDTEVTVLFCDISRFTEMSSTMEPRQVIKMLNDYFKVMVEDIVFKYEGTLEKYIGDALLAIWGAPYRLPDDADRAVKAACQMQRAVCRLNEQWQQQNCLPSHCLPIQIHIGINTGKVAAGNIGSPRLIQYATIGDTTNVTSRICSAAEGGQILISQSTFEALSDRTIPIEKISPVIVKGKDQPLQLYLVHWEQVITNQ